MKVKTLACLCALAAVPAFGNIAATSGNTFGVLKVTCSAQKVIIATPWVACATADAAVKVTDLVMTSGLANGDAILVYQNDGSFKSWVIADGEWVPQIVSQAGQTVSSGSADSAAIARGKAFWFVKNSFTAGDTYDLYLYGQDTSAAATSTIAPGTSTTPAYSLVASPNTTAANLNATGVVGFTPNAADEIRVPPTGGKLLDTVYTYKSGSGWGTEVIVSVGGRNKKQWQAGCTIPAGTGFWYVSKGGTGTISWQ